MRGAFPLCPQLKTGNIGLGNPPTLATFTRRLSQSILTGKAAFSKGRASRPRRAVHGGAGARLAHEPRSASLPQEPSEDRSPSRPHSGARRPAESQGRAVAPRPPQQRAAPTVFGGRSVVAARFAALCFFRTWPLARRKLFCYTACKSGGLCRKTTPKKDKKHVYKSDTPRTLRDSRALRQAVRCASVKRLRGYIGIC